MIGIYKIINPSGKIYIGQSIQIEKRWKYYKARYHNVNDKQNKLFNSFKKYGPENHKFEIIEECDINQLNEREIHWGKFYDCTNPLIGLNLRELGKQGTWTDEAKLKLSIAKKGRLIHTEESKKKIGNAVRGQKYTEEQRVKCGSGMKGKVNINGGSKKGWKWSDEQKENFKTKKLGNKNTKNLSHIIQCDLEGKEIKEWVSATQIQNEIGVRRDSIGNVLRNKQNTAGGFKWKYKTN